MVTESIASDLNNRLLTLDEFNKSRIGWLKDNPLNWKKKGSIKSINQLVNDSI